MYAMPTDPETLRAMLREETAALEQANERLRPRTTRFAPEDAQRLRLEASQAMPMPTVVPREAVPARAGIGRRLRALAVVVFGLGAGAAR